MKVYWRKSAIHSLLDLDKWRQTQELPRISLYLKESVEHYFRYKELNIHLPGRAVMIKGLPGGKH
ncbi:hypothetical protein ACOI1C_22735, partial [Bacillus sp. DJP31]|uniref:hypothetical protein n=1 Tax=Bacillus sp. DJP31 TaxID=3409789 RepID=UPI003BB5178A